MQTLSFNPNIELPVMEHFYTIQGEGRYAGRPAYFIRLAGCDIGCVWCDVKDSWERDISQLIKIERLVEYVKESGADYVVVTGGEPTLYDLTTLTDSLHQAGLKIGIETSGTNAIQGNFDWICLSPKKFKEPLTESYTQANEFKVIVYHHSDLEWGKELAKNLNSECILYLQPEWGKLEEIMHLILRFVKQEPKWNISLQTHKYLNIP